MGVTVLVALRKESVDRNAEDWLNAGCLSRVALRKESVDRNCCYSACCVGLLVALRKESVDRNGTVQIVVVVVCRRSPQGERG